MVNSNLKYLLENHTTYPNFVSLARLQVQFNNLAAVIIFLAWVKVRLKLYHLNVDCVVKWWMIRCPVMSLLWHSV